MGIEELYLEISSVLVYECHWVCIYMHQCSIMVLLDPQLHMSFDWNAPTNMNHGIYIQWNNEDYIQQQPAKQSTRNVLVMQYVYRTDRRYMIILNCVIAIYHQKPYNEVPNKYITVHIKLNFYHTNSKCFWVGRQYKFSEWPCNHTVSHSLISSKVPTQHLATTGHNDI